MSIFDQSNEMERLRQKNLKTVETYFTFSGMDRGKNRLPLWVEEDTLFELPYTRTCQPSQHIGRKALEEKENDANLTMFPDWGFYEEEIFQTQDPNFFVAECIGKGKIITMDGTESYYKNQYLIVFEMEDGKIKVLREIHNPCSVVMSMGVAIPQFPWYL